MAEVLNLYQKLAKIRKQVEVVQKNKSGYGYKYVTDDELLAKITVGIRKLWHEMKQSENIAKCMIFLCLNCPTKKI